MTTRSALNAALSWFGFGEAPDSQHRHDHHHHAHHSHGDHVEHGHRHTHGVIEPSIATTEQGIRAVKWSFVILAVTAVLQMIVVAISGSVALLADTIHNIGDATTAIPLWIAFLLARRKPTKTFNYGLGRVEDLAGIIIVLIIFMSAMVALWEAVDRFIHPQTVTNLGWLAAAGIIGFIGNEAVAVFRIQVGRRINSAALIADGYHARTDGLTSLAVIVGALGVWLGFPLADPIIGLLITVAILGIVWQSARAVLTRMLDGIDPYLIDEIHHAVGHVEGIGEVSRVKARWIGHRLHVEVIISLDGTMVLKSASRLADHLRSEIEGHIPAVAAVNVMFTLMTTGENQRTQPS